MLELLHIENIALIQEADIQFRPGFNALTGETGAGKSIVIDALGAVLGGAYLPGPDPHRRGPGLRQRGSSRRWLPVCRAWRRPASGRMRTAISCSSGS